MKFGSIPFFRFSLFLVLGIVFQIEFQLQSPFLAHIFCTVAIAFISIILFANQNFKYKFRNGIAVLGFALLFLFGLIITRFYDITTQPDHISRLDNRIEAYQAIIESEPEEKEKSIKAELNISKVKIKNQWINASGKLMAYFSKDSLSFRLKYGDVLLVNANPPLIELPKNPYEFNLKRFYGFKGITHRQFLKSSQYSFINSNPQNLLIAFAINIRQKVDAIFTKYIPAERERNVASALILGIKNELDDEIQYAYSATGTMHVLAVSGLHVGIIFSLLEFLTSFLLKLKRGNVIQSAILFVLIWLYALVTGLCPSVLRAVTMLSLVIVAKLIGMKSNVFNTLFVTVFLLLCINPFMIMEVGFQLSFMAVFGIVYIYPEIYHLVEINNKIMDWIWSISVMSIAAQLATFPLGMLYFHQFPNLFLLSNLVVIPFAILIMYVGFGFMALSWWPYVAHWLGLLVEKMVWVLNQTILFIEKIPSSLWLGIHISVFETWLIYAIIIFMVLLFVKQDFNYAIATFILVLFFCGIQIIKIYDWQNQRRIIVYNVNKGYGIDVIHGRNAVFISDSILPSDRQKMQFHILNHRWARGIKNAITYKNNIETEFGKLYYANGFTFAHITKPIYYSPSNHIKTDYLIASENAIKDLKFISKAFIFNTIIIDGSNKYYLANKLINQAKQLGIQVHSTAIDGAFVIDL